MIRTYRLLFASLFVAFIFLLINTKFLSMDELWCYSFAQRIANGYIPYKDFNIVVTPIFFYIGVIFSKSLLCFRVYGAMIDTGILLMTYYIFEKYQIHKFISFLFCMVNFALIAAIGFANYNTLLILGIMGIYLITEKFLESKNEKNSFLLGISLSIAFFIKQNIPVILIISLTLILTILFLRRTISLKTYLFYILGGFFPVTFFLIITFLNGSLVNFIDYTIKALNVFSVNQNFQRSSMLFLIISGIITVSIAVNILKRKDYSLITYLPLIFSLSSYITIYPIVDSYHSIMLLIFNVFLSATVVKSLQVKFLFILDFVVLLLIVVCASCSYYIMVGDADTDYIRSDVEYYQNIYINTKLEHNIALVSDFIKENEKKGYDVAIVGSNAYLYNIPAKDFNGILDLLLIGNIGTTSANEIKALIDKKDIILMGDAIGKYDIKEIRDYISDEYVLHGIIGNMNIYRKYKTAY